MFAKELQTDHHLNGYDYGARYYDPSLARWTTQDPLSEQYLGFSTYHYTKNNPIRFYDIQGMSAADDIWKQMADSSQAEYMGSYEWHREKEEEEKKKQESNSSDDKEANSMKKDIPLIFSYIGSISELANMTLNETKDIASLLKNISGIASKIGWTGEAISISLRFYDFTNNPNPGNLAKLQTSIGIAGINLTPGGPFASFGLSVVDLSGGFNFYYNTLNKINEKYGLYVIPPGLYPFPLIIPDLNKNNDHE